MKSTPSQLKESNRSHGMAPNRVAIPTPEGFVEFTAEECEQSIPSRFESIVSRHASRQAVKTRTHQLTYDELNRMANRIAHAILKETGPKEEPVALLLDHDAPLIASIIGILKAGKIYIPLDPSFPEERNAYMLEDSKSVLVLTNSKHLPLAESLSKSGHRFLNIEEIGGDTLDTNPGLDLDEDHLAYILYTSGSTGLPKGVAHTHINVLRTARRTTNGLRLACHDRLSLLPSCNVTASVIDLFGSLLNGAALFPYSVKEEGLDSLVDWLLKEKITVYHSTPTLFRHFAGALSGSANFPHLRVLRMGGEPCYRQDFELYKRRFSSHTVLVNAGGCSEISTVWQYNLDHTTKVEAAAVPIGYPIPDIQLLLLDETGNAVAQGETGEIVVKSRWLSPGYWGKPDLTHERFREAPEGDGMRLYFTGDLAYLTPDGCMVHAGRSDFQVKIRGYRIETAEIEQTIVSLGTIQECIVMARDDRRGDKQLVAYIVPRAGTKPSFGELRSGLNGKLPDYMLPAIFVVLDALPQTPNGKLNRLALPDPDQAKTRLEKDFIAPSTATEKTVAGIFSEVLQRTKVGVEDNFFELGGHSLLAIRALSRLRQTFEVDLPMRTLFEIPTVGKLAAHIETAVQSGSELRPPPILPANRDRDLPLSFAQNRLWFFDQLEPGSAAFNMTTSARLKGPLDIHALEKCFNEILLRHEGLRTAYTAVNGHPTQFVTPARNFPLPIEDLTRLPADQRQDAANKLAIAEGSTPFDLTKGPFLRMKVLRISSDEHFLLITMHHIASDGWSKGILFKELGVLYDAFTTGKTPQLPELPVQYKDFAAWQRDWIQGDLLESQITYWKQQLNGAPPVLELPTDRPRPAVQTYDGARISVVLPPELLKQLQSFSNGEGTTLFMTLLTTFNILLHRLSGQNNVVVGTPIAGRNRSEIENLIGFFLNTLALHTDLSGNPTFRQLLERLRGVALGAYAHQDLSFAKIVEDLHPKRSLSHSPIFQVLFNMYDYEIDAIHLSGLKVEVLPHPSIQSRFDLTLYVRQRPEKTELSLIYNTDLFDEARMNEMLNQFLELLSQVVIRPDEQIDHLCLVTPSSVGHLPDPASSLKPDEEEPVTAAFSRQAARAPDRIAVDDGDWTCKYGEMETKSNRLAHYLLKNGIQKGELVAIYRSRSTPLVWAILGVLKAGAAFVILDPSHPPSSLIERLRTVKIRAWLWLESAGELPEDLKQFMNKLECRCSLTLPSMGGPNAESPVKSFPATHPDVVVEADDLAYVAFTSGSTGTPKAILGTHRPLTHFIDWHVRKFNLTEQDRFSMVSGLGHDPLLRDIFAPLSVGATVLIPTNDDMEIPGRLAEWLEKNKVTVMHLTPAMGQLLTGDASKKIPSLRYAFFGGDALILNDVIRMKGAAPAIQCVNFYGTTETPQAMGHYIVPENEARDHIPVGVGIDRAQLLVLTPLLRPAGIGELGEIYIRTPYLSLGYLGDEVLTHERYCNNPFTEDPADRLYRTGDLGRYLPDGNVEFLGRRDHQVKIRGYRVELGAIETAIAQQANVRESVVIAREDTPGDRRIVAYIVLRPGDELSGTELRNRLAQCLPNYMIPSAFVFLEKLPLTANGKIDRRALPKPDAGRSGSENNFVPAQTPVEESLVEIWCEVLRIPRIGIQDNFFELGGHSLLATQVISRVNQRFDVQMPLRKLFESPTIEAMAIAITQIKAESADSDGSTQLLAKNGSPKPGIPRRTVAGPAALSFSQERLWFIEQLEVGHAVYNIPIFRRIIGRLNIEALAASLNDLVDRHEILRTTYSAQEGKPIQNVSAHKRIDLSVTDLTDRPEAARQTEALRIATEERRRPFDLARDVMLRFQLVRLADDEHWLLMTLHHIASDGWSVGVLLGDLSSLYQSYDKGQPPSLSKLPIQYADYAEWQRDRLRGKELERQLGYWKRNLAGVPSILELPTDRPRPPTQTFHGSTHSLPLDQKLCTSLHTLARREGISKFMMLLAAFQTLLSRYTSQEDIVVGSPIAGRNHTEVEGLIGFFVNTLVLRSDLSGNPGFLELLKRVREVCLGAYSHQDLPFEKLVEELQPERNPSHSPLFQVLFVLRSATANNLKIPGLSFHPVEVDSGTSKVDLTLFILEEADDRLRLRFEYNTDLFEKTTIARMAVHFQNLLEDIVNDPVKKISDLRLMDEEEQRQILVIRNNTSTNYPRDKTIPALFEEQVKKNPDSVAVVFGDRRLTYRELNDQANAIALQLRELGVVPDTLVTVCMERSMEMIAALLGILKAGGAYVPLDAKYPAERLAFMFEDSKAPILITHHDIDAKLPPHKATVLRLDNSGIHNLKVQSSNLELQITPDHLAYVIYTSGSTGQPKGVSIPHRSVVRLVKNTNFASMEADEVFLQLAPISFDASTLEIWGPLLNGGRLVVMPPHTPTLEEIGEAIRKHRITTLWLTAGLFHLMADERPADLKLLRQLLAGGDVLSPSHVKHVLEEAPTLRLINGYGPTENTTFTCCHTIRPEDCLRSIPIGRPIANTTVYILDGRMQPTPVGVVGELYTGGDGLAREYLNQPKMTAEKFVNDPFCNTPGARLYKTGDRARWLQDGTIEFLGRKDFQVKIRGFRIELGEIEAALHQQQDIAKAVVIVREDRPGDKSLVAYVVPKNGSLPPAEDLRGFLRKHIPDYMVPSAFVTMDVLPIDPNGKVDRKRLPAPDLGPQQEHVSPRNDIELRLLAVWEEVLDKKGIGMTDGFFEVGGHSLMAVRLFAKIEKTFGKRLPLSVLFQAPTIELLARELGKDAPTADWESVVPIRATGSRPPFFCVHGAGGNVLFCRDLARLLGPDQPFYAVQSQGLDGRKEPRTRIEEMATEYLKEIRRIQPEGPYYLGGFCMGGAIAWEMARRLQAEGETIAFMAFLESYESGYVRERRKIKRLYDFEGKTLGQRIRKHLDEMSKLNFSGKITHILNKLQNFKQRLRRNTKRSIDAVRFRFGDPIAVALRRVNDANEVALLSYSPEGSISAPLTLFVAQTKRVGAEKADPYLGWSRRFMSPIEIQEIPGIHGTIFEPENIEVCASKLGQALHRSQTREVSIPAPVFS